MGTSTASEATINTSTDSASTLVTNVTSNTDTDANDSLDLGGEHSCSGQSEPLLSSLDETNSISSLVSPRLAKSRASDQESLIESPCTVYYQKRPLKHHNQASSSISEDDDLIEIAGLENYPRTAPAIGAHNNQSTRFPFDNRPVSISATSRTMEKTNTKPYEDPYKIRKSSGKFAIDSSSSSSSSPSSVSANTVTIVSPSKSGVGVNGEPKAQPRKEPRLSSNGGGNIIAAGLNRVVFRDKISSKKRINSAPLDTSSIAENAKLMDNTMFPFDREAIDYERIQRECFAVEESKESPRHYPFLDLDTDPESPIFEKPASIFQSPSKSPYRRSKCNASHSNVHEVSEMTERFKYPTGGGGHDKNDDIFRQYAILSEQEKNKGQQDKERDRRSPSMKRTKGSVRKSDAFSPKLAKSRHSPGYSEQEDSFTVSSSSAAKVSQFEQINSKFEQIPPNQKRVSNCFNANGNAHKSGLALSPTMHHYHVGDPNYSPTVVRVTPPLPDLRVDYFNSQQRDSDEEQGNDECDLEDLVNEGNRIGRSKRKSPDRSSINSNNGKSHSHSPYHTQQAGNSSEDDQKQQTMSGLDKCQKNAQLRSINVTPNPMDQPVCSQPPRATIVVQQVIYNFFTNA